MKKRFDLSKILTFCFYAVAITCYLCSFYDHDTSINWLERSSFLFLILLHYKVDVIFARGQNV